MALERGVISIRCVISILIDGCSRSHLRSTCCIIDFEVCINQLERQMIIRDLLVYDNSII
jgi:hypothetical protein